MTLITIKTVSLNAGNDGSYFKVFVPDQSKPSTQHDRATLKDNLMGLVKLKRLVTGYAFIPETPRK